MKAPRKTRRNKQKAWRTEAGRLNAKADTKAGRGVNRRQLAGAHSNTIGFHPSMNRLLAGLLQRAGIELDMP